MELRSLIQTIQEVIPSQIAENYDNCGLQIGKIGSKISKVLVCLECTDRVLEEAISLQVDLIISHHPLIFNPIKNIVDTNVTSKLLLKLITSNIGLYCLHTNLDNLANGVNKINADKLDLIGTNILEPKPSVIRKLTTFVPDNYLDKLKEALFNAGAGNLGNYENCSFTSSGVGSFKPKQEANPFLGTVGQVSLQNEAKLEVLYPYWIENKVMEALFASHPYEEVAFYITTLNNKSNLVGSGIIGSLKQQTDTKEFTSRVKKVFNCQIIKHSALVKNIIKKVAFCGGSGGFLIDSAIKAEADIFISADIKYHDFFKCQDKIIILDIGHYESEQYVPLLIKDILSVKMPKLEFFISKINTNPVFYY